ncbi:hypothetical protein EXIGLDRAFT_724312 [Exidia glandulosa HHB12029]|uniref:Uncharacterized protein n=1 Tax=Exidia glandulosa HHB12029 TaxID=1314781 RepID=A0A165MU57_EXIGL|nr:hypothetical protein EXIGLDRAFT_724312 [Exidia glandulosa HHB12029]
MNALQTSLLLRTPAPELEEFALHHTFAHDADPLVLMPNIFRGHAPQLGRITLDGVQLNADGAYPAFADVTTLRHFHGASRLPEMFPRLTDCAFVHESGLAPSVGPLTNPLRRLSFVSPTDLIVELLTQLGPLALVHTREIDIDCPCSADAMLYLVQAIDAPFRCEIHMLKTKPLNAYVSIKYDDGRTRLFQRPEHISTLLPVLERIAQKCTSLACPVRLLWDIPPLRALHTLNVDLEDNFTHSQFLDAAISSALSLDHTPHLRSLTLIGHGTAYTRLRPHLFLETIQRRRILALPRADTFRQIVVDGIKFAGETDSASDHLRRLANSISLRVRQGDDDESAPFGVAGTWKTGRTGHGTHESVGKRGVREMGKLLAGQRQIQMDSRNFML